MITRIISGAQTGADRGALDAAFDLGLPRGGWAPLGWRAEDGVIPVIYRKGMRQADSAHYQVRTKLNVEDSDGTLILSTGPLTYDSGSLLTASHARRRGKPYRHAMIDADGGVPGITLDRMRQWMSEHPFKILNVAGPRESREPGIQAAVRKALATILSPT